MWFHKLPIADACYSVTKGVDCDTASQTYLPWAQAEVDQVRFFGLSATGYVQNRDMEVSSGAYNVTFVPSQALAVQYRASVCSLITWTKDCCPVSYFVAGSVCD